MTIVRHVLTKNNMAGLALSLRGEAGQDPGLSSRVGEIIGRVREGGDQALVNYTREFDYPEFNISNLKVTQEEIDAALAAASDSLMDALKQAAENVRLFHQHEMRGSWTAPMRQSQMLGQRMIPVDRAGIYIPGGGGSYPSSVIMAVVPAQVAAVKEIFICTPPGSDGLVNSVVLAAAGMLGVTEIYRAGGAQAIAAMAYGTSLIRPADVICGPGNVYVTEAKRQVYGRVGVDSLAGPSEVLIIAGKSANAELIAIDLLAQVEHGSGAIGVLVCWSEELAGKVEASVASQARDLGIDEARIGNISFVMIPDGQDAIEIAIDFSNHFAPEHLQIHTEHPEQVVHEITCAGAVFLGEEVCAAYGDYIIGSNHVLPTAGAARFSSALSVENFLRKVAVISLIPATVSELTPQLIEIAQTEGFKAHARAAQLRMQIYGAPVEDE